mgnify:CR=1 FL=1
MITNKNGLLLGSITDGDIRRALINQLGMNTWLKDIMSKNPSVTFIEEERSNILTIKAVSLDGLLKKRFYDAGKECA